MNTAEILIMKFPNADFSKDILLRATDDGKIEIYQWQLKDPIPKQADLDQWALELDLPYRQKQAVLKRNYPSINDQLDMIYHDCMEGTFEWRDMITEIKMASPKPLE
jgi:hypothetical protein